MLHATLSRLTYANVMATIAVFIALGGGAYALSVPRNSVGAKQISRNAVGAAEITKGAVRSSEVKNSSLLAADFKPGELLQGPAGPPGRDGVNGVNGAANVTYRTAESEPLNQGQYGRITVGCQAGERLIGGGAGFPYAIGNSPTYTEFTTLGTSAPGILINPQFHIARAIEEGETPNVWAAAGYQGEANSRTLQVYAVCATP
jgi:hypothetical protein